MRSLSILVVASLLVGTVALFGPDGDPMKCISWGYVHPAFYTDANGHETPLGDGRIITTRIVLPPCWSQYSDEFGVFKCHGRNGPSCDNPEGNYGWNWAVDAFDHDSCVYDLFGADPGLDVNTIIGPCAAEFTYAMDDYFFGLEHPNYCNGAFMHPYTREFGTKHPGFAAHVLPTNPCGAAADYGSTGGALVIYEDQEYYHGGNPLWGQCMQDFFDAHPQRCEALGCFDCVACSAENDKACYDAGANTCMKLSTEFPRYDPVTGTFLGTGTGDEVCWWASYHPESVDGLLISQENCPSAGGVWATATSAWGQANPAAFKDPMDKCLNTVVGGVIGGLGAVKDPSGCPDPKNPKC